MFSDVPGRMTFRLLGSAARLIDGAAYGRWCTGLFDRESLRRWGFFKCVGECAMFHWVLGEIRLMLVLSGNCLGEAAGWLVGQSCKFSYYK